MNINHTPYFALIDFEELSKKIIKVAEYPHFSEKIKILSNTFISSTFKVEETKVTSELNFSY